MTVALRLLTSAHAQLSQNWTVDQCRQAWGKEDPSDPSYDGNKVTYHFRTFVHDVKMAVSAIFVKAALTKVEYAKKDSLPLGLIVQLFMDNAPDTKTIKWEDDTARLINCPTDGRTWIMRNSEVEGDQVEYSAVSYNYGRGIFYLRIQLGFEAE